MLERLRIAGCFQGSLNLAGRTIEVTGITKEGRQLGSGYPTPKVEDSVPQLETLGPHLEAHDVVYDLWPMPTTSRRSSPRTPK